MIKIKAPSDEIHICSDLHINHVNLVTKLSKWESGATRDFKSVNHMNVTILSNINKYVLPHHYLFILGDLMFGNKDYDTLFKSINCSNIFVLRGNHDNVEKLTKACKDNNIIYLGWRENVIINGKLCVLSHEPILSWDSIGRNSYHFYGHVHDNIRTGTSTIHNFYNSIKAFDVGIDSSIQLLGEYKPFTYEYLVDIMDKRDILAIDHHDQNTNR
jgi:calcineurin-like phosphoesterase family protein